MLLSIEGLLKDVILYFIEIIINQLTEEMPEILTPKTMCF